jgi:hypothetical protein
MVRSKKWLALAVGVMLLLAAGCGTASINQVLADPGKYRNQAVTVHGTVDESVSILGRGAYRITNGDQHLWVVTNAGAPRKGARVDVTGRVQEGYDLSAFGNAIKLPGSLQSGVVLVESSHKARD